MKKIKLLLVLLFFTAPNFAFACACGCSLLDVATSSLIPTSKGGLVFAQYDYLNQDRNWHGSNRADDSESHDLKITTRTMTLGGQYMFNREWGLMARLPYVERKVSFLEGHNEGHHHIHEARDITRNAVGDVKIMGIYSGFSPDMSSGLIFGMKLPTGAFKQDGFEKHMQIGTGSYDAILGFYHLGQVSKIKSLGWFAQATYQKPLLTKKSYHTGAETSAALGLFYDLGQFGMVKKVAPMLQLIATHRARDGGVDSDTENSGYKRAFIAPGIEVDIEKLKLYADVELPIYQYVNGHQLAVEKIFKMIVGYKF